MLTDLQVHIILICTQKVYLSNYNKFAVKSFVKILFEDCFLILYGMSFQILTQSAVNDLLDKFNWFEVLKW